MDPSLPEGKLDWRGKFNSFCDVLKQQGRVVNLSAMD